MGNTEGLKRGNTRNVGRKPSELRKRMRGNIEAALPTIEAALKAKGEEKLKLHDALAIIDRLGKYGLGERQVTLDKEELLSIVLETAMDYVPAERWADFAAQLGDALEDV